MILPAPAVWHNFIGWWCACPRTGMHLGPFDTKEEAEEAQRE